MMTSVGDLAAAVDAVARDTGFSGVVRVDVGGRTMVRTAYGLADRRLGVPMTPDSMLAMASGSKAFTALAAMRLVEQGRLALSTRARELLGEDLPLVADDVTVEHLLGHRSGIGDYLDEEGDLDVDDYVLPVPVQRLVTTTDFLPILEGFPTKFAPGTRFSYCNGGYMALALIVERAGGHPFHDLVATLVTEPAGMTDTGYPRSDDLPGRAAVGYVIKGESVRSNVFHLPVRGNGDGGAYTTVDDMDLFWDALLAGRIVGRESLARMTRPGTPAPEDEHDFGYGLGFWLRTDGTIQLEGEDAGVSFRSCSNPDLGTRYTVIANDTVGAWPVARLIATEVSDAPGARAR